MNQLVVIETEAIDVKRISISTFKSTLDGQETNQHQVVLIMTTRKIFEICINRRGLTVGMERICYCKLISNMFEMIL